MEAVLANTNKTIVEAPGVNSYLPLPALRRGNAPADAQTQGGAK